MFLFAVCFPLIANAAVQEQPQEKPRSEFNRLGGQAVENEPDLDLWLPESNEPVESDEDRLARLEQERRAVIDKHLAAAAAALNAGRLDVPYENSAWAHYRAVLEMEPDNEAALLGLVSVQEALVETARVYAKDLDFETAGRVLDSASQVSPEQDVVLKARKEIFDFRASYAEELEKQAVTAMDAGRFDEAERALIGLVALGDMDPVLRRLRNRLEEARVYGGLKPGQLIRDHFMDGGFWTPESVIVRAGSFMMGAPAFEEGREDNEGPQHRVVFQRGFAIGRSEVTVDQFREFVKRSGYRSDAEKFGYSLVYDHYSGRMSKRERVNWRHDYEGREATDDPPVLHVSWNDAKAYAHWLAMGTGKPYRLPTEAEFEYALRAGSVTRFWWGDGAPEAVVENLTGERDVSRSRRQWDTFFENYGDRFWGPAPTASFASNPWGLHDIGGNAAEWVMDCWHDSYIRAPVDGRAWVNPGCDQRVVRGGYWASSPDRSRSAYRVPASASNRDARTGFRIARDL
jgi:formylglycine-generating enzyme required for sulfatase activity